MKKNYEKSLVFREGDQYVPLFTEQDVSRDQFIHLRKQLVQLGCDKRNVIKVAKELTMNVLNLSEESEYHSYILRNTYDLCYSNIAGDKKIKPIQDINSGYYSHIDLFSCIYGFEIKFLKDRDIYSSVADIGCGDGLFLKLMQENKINAEGFEIEEKPIRHNVPINIISDIKDIQHAYRVVIMNHVLEHIEEPPHEYLNKLFNHFESIGPGVNEAFIFSLPLHLSIEAHLASHHIWVCCEGDIEKSLLDAIKNNNLNYYCPSKEFDSFAKANNYRLYFDVETGVYVIQRNK